MGKLINGLALLACFLFCGAALWGIVFLCIDHHRIREVEEQVREDKVRVEWLVKKQNEQWKHNQRVIGTFRKMGRW